MAANGRVYQTDIMDKENPPNRIVLSNPSLVGVLNTLSTLSFAPLQRIQITSILQYKMILIQSSSFLEFNKHLKHERHHLKMTHVTGYKVYIVSLYNSDQRDDKDWPEHIALLAKLMYLVPKSGILIVAELVCGTDQYGTRACGIKIIIRNNSQLVIDDPGEIGNYLLFLPFGGLLCGEILRKSDGLNFQLVEEVSKDKAFHYNKYKIVKYRVMLFANCEKVLKASEQMAKELNAQKRSELSAIEGSPDGEEPSGSEEEPSRIEEASESETDFESEMDSDVDLEAES